MTRPSLTYTYYKANGGSLTEEEFKPLLGQAAGLVDWLTATREVIASNEDAYLRAICAVIGTINEHSLDEPGMSSINIGSFGMVYGMSNAISGEDAAVKAASYVLARAVPSLLYGGIR